MSLFMPDRFVYTHDKARSQAFLSIYVCTLRGARTLRRPGRRYRIRTNDEAGRLRNWFETVKRLRSVLRNAPFGTQVVMEALGTDGREVDQARFFRLQGAAVIPDLGVHPDLNVIHAAVWGEFGRGVRSGGRYVCRFVAGTTTVSKHGYVGPGWRGAAEDIFVQNPDSMAHLDQVAAFIVRETTHGPLRASRVIIGQRMWSANTGWDIYPGIYHTHVHCEVEGGSPCR